MILRASSVHASALRVGSRAHLGGAFRLVDDARVDARGRVLLTVGGRPWVPLRPRRLVRVWSAS